MKKVLIVALLLLLAIGITIAIPTVTAHADETDEVTTEFLPEEPPPSEDGAVEEQKIDTAEWLKTEFLPEAASLVLLFIGMWISTRPQAFNNNALARQMVAFANSLGENKKVSEDQVKEIMTKYVELKNAFEISLEQIAAYKQEIGELLKTQKAMIDIMKLGFGNNTELVKKGTAELICNIADKAEVKKDDEKVA